MFPMVPAGHAVHAMSADSCPSDSQKPPSWQGSQLVLPDTSLKLPGVHGAQLLLPFPENAECDPGAHGMQLSLFAAPVAGRCVPAGHGRGSVLPVGQKWPSQHTSPQRGDV